MKKIILGLLTLFALSGCGGSTTVVSLTERITKLWIASSVRHDGIAVYTTGATSNVLPSYASFTLNLSTGTVTLVDLDGIAITGKWEVSADEKKLILKGLNPPPNGTAGIIEYTIDSLSDTQLTLSRTTNNAKTGGKVATYFLTVK
ncbi:putative periplasmic lipoprotein [Spirosoma jeollabukense]